MAEPARASRSWQRDLAGYRCSGVYRRIARRMERAGSLNLKAALDGISKLYVDSAPLIYYVEEHFAFVDKMEYILYLVENTSLEAVSSVLTLSEVLVAPVRTGAHHLAQRYRTIRS